MMNRPSLAAILLVAALSLSACNGNVANDIAVDGAENSSGTADEKSQEAQEVKEYLESEIVSYPSRAFYEMRGMFKALESGDTDTVKQLNDSVSDTANAFITDNSAPYAASDFRYAAALACAEVQRASGYLYLTSLGGPDAADYLSEATSSIQKVDDHFKQMNLELDSLISEFGITISNEYITEAAEEFRES